MIKEAYIKKLRGKNLFRVYSEEGKNLGTYKSMIAAKKRLKQIEYFKHKSDASDHLMPRGGDGNVPPFFRRNLDYGERDIVLRKKLKKLKSLSQTLEQNGFIKEAAEIKNLKARAAMTALVLSLAASLIGVASSSLANVFSDETETVVKTIDNPYKEFVTPVDKKLIDIISDTYPTIPTRDILLISHSIADENNLLSTPLEEIVIRQGQTIRLFDNDKIKGAVEKLSNTIDEKDFADLEKVSLPYQDVKFSPNELDFISGTEGEVLTAYDDRSSATWSEGIDPVGSWTIGKGHKLKQSELDSGVIMLNNNPIDWMDGITKEEADALHRHDLAENVETVEKYMKDYNISLSQKKIIYDIGFQYGTGRAKDLIKRSIVDKKVDNDKLLENLKKFHIADDPGAAARRIAQLLVLGGVKFPAPPEDIKMRKSDYYKKYFNGNMQDMERRFILPTKELVDAICLGYAGFDTKTDNQGTGVRMSKLLELTKENTPNNLNEFLYLVRLLE